MYYFNNEVKYTRCKIKKTHGPSFLTRSRIVANVLFDFLFSSTAKKEKY